MINLNDKRTLYILGGGVLVGVIASLVTGRSYAMSGSINPSINPYKWGSSKQRLLRRWNSGEVGTVIRRMTPQAWPGVPFEAFLGFAANGTNAGETTADTARQPPYGVSNSFHEIGIFGTEAGLLSESTMGRFPGIAVDVPLAPANGTSHNTWRTLASHPDVVRLLGRPAKMGLNEWVALEDQTAVGLANIRRHLNGTVRAAGGGGPSDPNSLWAVALGFGGWSAGDGGMGAHLRRYRDVVSQYSDDRKWGAFLAAIARDVVAGRVSGSKHRNPAYSAMRTWQKLEGGRQFAAENGGRPDWFSTQLQDEAQVAAILDAEYRRAGGR